MILIGFLFYRSHVVMGRPGFRIDGVLSRGALKWVTWSHLCGELKPLHTWHFIFLGFYVAFLLVGFWCLSWSSWQAQVLRKRISYGKLAAFSCWKFHRFIPEESSTHSFVCQLDSFMVCNISTFGWKVLVVIFLSKLILSRLEFYWRRYVFRKFFCLLGRPPARPRPAARPAIPACSLLACVLDRSYVPS